MRPGEVCIMRTCDIDRGGDVWAYKPSHHKSQHHVHERLVVLKHVLAAVSSVPTASDYKAEEEIKLYVIDYKDRRIKPRRHSKVPTQRRFGKMIVVFLFHFIRHRLDRCITWIGLALRMIQETFDRRRRPLLKTAMGGRLSISQCVSVLAESFEVDK
jgi:hypothetical protein